MTSRSDVLRGLMLETGTTQSDLSRLSDVRQLSISGFLSGKVHTSDDQLDRLLSAWACVTRSYDAPSSQGDTLRASS